MARAFGAYELNVPKKFPQEMISRELNKEYKLRLTSHNAPDPNEVLADQWIDDVRSWPDLDEGKLFSFILKHKAVDSDYIGKYKDQKTFSFYESGFVGTLYTYTVPAKRCCLLKEMLRHQLKCEMIHTKHGYCLQFLRKVNARS